MKIYSKYKYSGEEYFGEIPECWDLLRIGYFSELITGFPFESKDFSLEAGIKVLRGDNVTEGRLRWGDKARYWSRITDELKGVQLKENDIVIGMDGSKVGKNYSMIFQSDLPLLLVQRVCRIRILNENNPRWILYQIGSMIFKNYINNLKTDPMIPHITQKNVFDFKVSIPPLNEQQQGVKYLDLKSYLIDNLIQKKLRKIEILKEHRTTIINLAVTKGLNPEVKMKDSWIEWIDMIPEHWMITRIDFICNLFGRLGWKSLKAEEYVDDGFIFLSTPNIKSKNIDFENVNHITEERYNESPEIMLEIGDVLLVKDGSTLGIVNVVRNLPRPATVNSSIGVLKIRSDNLVSEFLYYFLSSHFMQNIIERIKGGMGVPHLFQADIKKFPVLLPPIIEQKQIVSFLDRKTSEIDKQVDLENRKIDLLKEYRQSLISEVVTGKIDVRTN